LTAETPADRLRAAILALATARGADGSTCPSDAARAVAVDWRPLLPEARELRVNLSVSSCVYSPRRGGDMDGPTEAEVIAARKGLAKRGVRVAEPTTLLALRLGARPPGYWA
jgi:hypothetical protein